MQAVIFIGIQASGKSSFFKERFFDTHVRVSLDLLKTRHREHVFMNACLMTGQNFVVDNTNPTAEDRQRYIVPARAAHFEVTGYYFETNLAAALQRNGQRQGKQRIPEKGVRAAYYKLQVPALSEGFDKLYTVRIVSPGEFVVDL